MHILIQPYAPQDTSSELADRLYAETEGLPFFINEYLRLIQRQDADTLSVWELPGGVRDLMRFRLAAINDLDRQLLSTGAVIGRSFGFELLRDISGRSEEEVLTSLDSLLAQGLVTELPMQDDDTEPFQYDFYHGKLRTVLYQELSFARQRLLHRRVAQHLSDNLRQEASPALLGHIAHHYQQAREDDRAAQHYFEAGQRAQHLYAHSEALAYYEHALALGYQNSASIHYGIGQVLTFQGRYGDAISRFETAAAQAEGILSARIEHRIAQVNHRLGEWEPAEQHYQMALGMVQDSQQGIAARILADWCLTAHRRGNHQHAQQLAQDSLAYATQSDDQSALTQVHNILGILSRDAGDYQQAIRYLEQSIEIAIQTRNLGAQLAALNNLALAYRANMNMQDALEMAQHAIMLCEQYGDRHLEAALHSNLGDILHELGRTSDAEAHQKLSAGILADIDAGEGITRPEIWKLVEW
jgi:predicted ATPase